MGGVRNQRGSVSLRVLVLILIFGSIGATVTVLLVRDAPRRAIAGVVRDYLAEERAREWKDELLFAAAESDVDPYLLAGLMIRESSGRVDARSSVGALGLFQLLPITYNWRAQKLGLPPPTEEQLLSDGLLNARLGANNLRWLLDTYDGDVERSLVAYSLGMGRLKEYCIAAGGWEAWRDERMAAGDSRLLAYAHKIMEYRDAFRAAGILEPEDGEDG